MSKSRKKQKSSQLLKNSVAFQVRKNPLIKKVQQIQEKRKLIKKKSKKMIQTSKNKTNFNENKNSVSKSSQKNKKTSNFNKLNSKAHSQSSSKVNQKTKQSKIKNSQSHKSAQINQMRLTRGKKQKFTISQRRSIKQNKVISKKIKQNKQNKGIKILNELKQKTGLNKTFPWNKKIKKNERAKMLFRPRVHNFQVSMNESKSKLIKQNTVQIKESNKKEYQIKKSQKISQNQKSDKRGRGRPKNSQSIQKKELSKQKRQTSQELIIIKKKPGRPTNLSKSIDKIQLKKQISIKIPFTLKKQQYRPYNQAEIKILDSFLQELIHIRKIKSVLQIYSNRGQIFEFIKDSCKYGELRQINHVPTLNQIEQKLEKKIRCIQIKPQK